MLYSFHWSAFAVFAFFVVGVVGFSFFLGRSAKTASGYYAAHGQIPWFVNGIAFAGDYLSAASFLGICGMIAFYGFDGFLYSIGYLAGWIVALFIIAEPMKKLGKFTFADALDARFQSRPIRLVAAISTLVVSIFYLIPQMVGAGALVKPLLGIDFEYGVILVGAVVITIVVTAGMVSTTWVQFIKGGLLVLFCIGLVGGILLRGHRVTTDAGRQTIEKTKAGVLVNGKPQSVMNDVHPVGHIASLAGGKTETGPLGPIAYIQEFAGAKIVLAKKKVTPTTQGSITEFSPAVSSGRDMLAPGQSPTFAGLKSGKTSDRLNFISLMLALFAGTASLPHILIRYYTVKDAAAARKSTVVGIGAIGAFYVLTLFLGLAAMTTGVVDPTDSNMSAPLLARSFGELPFALVSAIAFTTVLGTVSGLILAASGAVAHDLMTVYLKMDLNDTQKVRAGKIAAVVVGVIGICLGMAFKGFNVTFLVGWAFNVAASANLPALTLLLFWSGTTKQGIVAGMLAGLLTSVGWILLSGDAMTNLYGLAATSSPVPFNQPAIITLPLGYLVVWGVSLATRPRMTAGVI